MQATEKSISNSFKRQLADIDTRKMFDAEKIRQCQELLDTASAKFLDEAYQQVEELHLLCSEAAANSTLAEPRLRAITTKAHVLKGRLESLGFVFCYDITDSLYRYLSKLKKYDHIAVMVAAKHIEAIHAAIREKHANDGGNVGKEMAETLEKLVKKLQ